jgi:hypothetical protein
VIDSLTDLINESRRLREEVEERRLALTEVVEEARAIWLETIRYREELSRRGSTAGRAIVYDWAFLLKSGRP